MHGTEVASVRHRLFPADSSKSSKAAASSNNSGETKHLGCCYLRCHDPGLVSRSLLAARSAGLSCRKIEAAFASVQRTAAAVHTPAHRCCWVPRQHAARAWPLAVTWPCWRRSAFTRNNNNYNSGEYRHHPLRRAAPQSLTRTGCIQGRERGYDASKYFSCTCRRVCGHPVVYSWLHGCTEQPRGVRTTRWGTCHATLAVVSSGNE